MLLFFYCEDGEPERHDHEQHVQPVQPGIGRQPPEHGRHGAIEYGLAEEKEIEVELIELTDTIPHPKAVMVVLVYARIALNAVLHPQPTGSLTVPAIECTILC